MIALKGLWDLGGDIADGLPELAILLALLLDYVCLLELLVLGLVVNLHIAGFQQFAEAGPPLVLASFL